MRNPRCVITFPVRASGRALESWASLGLLHDLHESAGVEDLQVPLGERRPEFVPANHFDPLVSALRELDPVRAFHAAWSKPLLLRLLNGGFDAHRFHDQVDPSGTRPHNRPLTDASRGQYIIVVRTRSSRETFYRGALCRNMVRFGSSGIRGLGNVEVTPELALRVGSVIGELYGDSVIGRDPRITGPMLVQAFAAGVLSTGSAAVDAGLVSTPTLARGARDFACGAMITASHNPAPYNGIKLWNPDGMAFDEAQQREVEEALDRSRFAGPTWDRIGAVFSRSDLVQQHIDAILKDVGTAKGRVDGPRGPAPEGESLADPRGRRLRRGGVEATRRGLRRRAFRDLDFPEVDVLPRRRLRGRAPRGPRCGASPRRSGSGDPAISRDPRRGLLSSIGSGGHRDPPRSRAPGFRRGGEHGRWLAIAVRRRLGARSILRDRTENPDPRGVPRRGQSKGDIFRGSIERKRGRCMKAVVLAAGEGTRMKHLTANLPKPLPPVAGKPFLRHTLEALGAAGVREIAILIGWQGHRIREG